MLTLFKKLTKKDLGFIGLVLIFIVGQVYLELQLPVYMQTITIMVQTPGSELNQILFVGGLMLLAALGSLVLSGLVAILVAQVSTHFSASLRESLYNTILSFSMEDISHYSTPSLITRSTNDVTQIQMFLVMGLQMIIRSPIMATWAILRISTQEWAWTLSTAIAATILFITMKESLVRQVKKNNLQYVVFKVGQLPCQCR